MTLRRRIRSVILPSIGIVMISGSVLASLACGSPPEQQGTDPAVQAWSEIIPENGTPTAYGISLSLDNTQQFIDWYYSIQLSAEQLEIRDMALSSQVAPCCDEYPMSTCCCECNLYRSIWGLSVYLITEKDYGATEVQESALQWAHFIRPDYYVASELEQKGIDPALWGFTTESSCFAGNCERLFYSETSDGHLGGCGGMQKLIQA